MVALTGVMVVALLIRFSVNGVKSVVRVIIRVKGREKGA
jgi:hypothetical protein